MGQIKVPYVPGPIIEQSDRCCNLLNLNCLRHQLLNVAQISAQLVIQLEVIRIQLVAVILLVHACKYRNPSPFMGPYDGNAGDVSLRQQLPWLE